MPVRSSTASDQRPVGTDDTSAVIDAWLCSDRVIGGRDTPEVYAGLSSTVKPPVARPDEILLILGDFRGDIWLMDLDSA
jgi:hypothetical protein